MAVLEAKLFFLAFTITSKLGSMFKSVLLRFLNTLYYLYKFKSLLSIPKVCSLIAHYFIYIGKIELVA